MNNGNSKGSETQCLNQDSMFLALDKEQLGALILNIQVGVVLIDAETHMIVDLNAKAAEIIGCERGKILQKECHEFICLAKHGQCPITDLGQEIDNAENIMLRWNGNKIPILKTVKRFEIDGHPYILDSFVDLTEQKATQSALRASEEMFKRLYDESPSGLALVDGQGFIKEANRSLLDLIGAKSEDLVGKNFMALVASFGLDSETHISDFSERLTSGRSMSELAFVRPDGIKKIVSVQSSPIISHGNPPHLLYILADITERKKIEIALAESEERFRAIFDNTRDGILVSNTDGNFLFSNLAMSEMLGYAPEEMKALKVTDIHPPKDLPAVMNVFNKAAGNEINMALDLPMLRKDGSVFYVNISGNILNLNGETCLVGVFRDITDRKKASEQLLKSETYLRSIIESMDEGVMIIGPDFRIKDVNKTIIDKFGSIKEHMVGECCHKISHLREFPCEAPQDPCPLKHVMETGEPFKVVHTHFTNSGEVRFIEIIASPIHDTQGEITSIVEVLRDITERKKMEDALKTNLYDLERYKKATVDRELKMKELKDKIKQLEQRRWCDNEPA